MKALFRYLLRSKRGILSAVLISAAANLIFGLGTLAMWAPARRYAVQGMMGDSDFTPEQLTHILRCVRGDYMDLVSLIAAVICFAFLCGNAFRFGTANGVSRGTVIHATLISAFLTAAGCTVLNETIRLGLVYGTPFFTNQSLYTELCGARFGYIDYPETISVTRLPSLNIRSVICYFAAACVLFSVVCCLYALRRRFGGVGLFCGSMTAVIFWIMFCYIRNSYGSISKALHKLFYEETPVNVRDLGLYIRMLHPKLLPTVISIVLVTALFAAAFAVCMKKTGIRPEQ